MSIDPRSAGAGRRAAVIRPGSSPRLHARLAALVGDAFPEFVVDDIDIEAEMRRRPVASGMAFSGAVVEYGLPIARQRIHPRKAVQISANYERSVRRIVTSRVSPATHVFTLQSQSLYSAAVPGVPHFVYTDHVHLANLSYPGFDTAALAPGRFLRREAALYRRAAKIFTRSNHVRDALIHGYGCEPDRVEVIGVGPNLPPSPPHPEWAGGRIIFVGVDWRRKGGSNLVEAFQRVREQVPTARLEIVGCAPPCASVPGVTVHGKLPMPRVAQLLGECDVFCLPSRAEPFGVAYIEAMLAGLPVVSSRIGAVDDFVIDGVTGYQVDCDRPDELATVLTQMLDDPEATQEMGQRALELAAQNYDWDVVMAKLRAGVCEVVGAEARR